MSGIYIYIYMRVYVCVRVYVFVRFRIRCLYPLLIIAFLPPPIGVSGVSHLTTSDSEALIVDYPFIAITPKSTRIRLDCVQKKKKLHKKSMYECVMNAILERYGIK